LGDATRGCQWSVIRDKRVERREETNGRRKRWKAKIFLPISESKNEEGDGEDMARKEGGGTSGR
jgi:hypothetical protein